MPLPVIQKLLGHTKLEMTLRYVHVDPETVRRTALVTKRVMAAPTTTKATASEAFVPQASTSPHERQLAAA